jgi:1-acyl-sn-glycerol-3-phosphate acyltransferase
MMTDLWQPQSTCGYHCLPDSRRRDISIAFLVVGRLIATIAVVLAAALTIALIALLPGSAMVRARRTFARGVLRAMGIKHRVIGRVPDRRALLVANHVSWIDVLVLLGNTPARLLAKHEVREWPVIGRIARAMGTVFVDRSKPKALPETVRAVAAAMDGGGVVAVFPEGTTWCGRNVGRFRPAMFQAAIDAGVPVLPVRLDFTIDGEPTTLAAFLGADTLYASVRRVVAARGMTVTLRTFSLLYPDTDPDAQIGRRATGPAARREARRLLARASAAALGREPRQPAKALMLV